LQRNIFEFISTFHKKMKLQYEKSIFLPQNATKRRLYVQVSFFVTVFLAILKISVSHF
jgi:hypothetical protein